MNEALTAYRVEGVAGDHPFCIRIKAESWSYAKWYAMLNIHEKEGLEWNKIRVDSVVPYNAGGFSNV